MQTQTKIREGAVVIYDWNDELTPEMLEPIKAKYGDDWTPCTGNMRYKWWLQDEKEQAKWLAQHHTDIIIWRCTPICMAWLLRYAKRVWFLGFDKDENKWRLIRIGRGRVRKEMSDGSGKKLG